MPAYSTCTDTIDGFVHSACYIGGPQTGKTRMLVRRACELAETGESVLFVCAVPEHVLYAERLAEERLCDGSSVHIADARSVALGIMEEPCAMDLFGRKPRVLDPFEERFLLEDMRTASIKGRRLQEVMEFLRSGWSRLADDDPKWLITLEEESIAKLMRENLRFMGGILGCELGNLSVNVLRRNSCIRERHSFDHVLVDDFERLDRATQVLTRMVARKSYVFSADVMEAVPSPGMYPYFAGVEEFLTEHENAQTVRLESACRPKGLAQTEGRLCAAYAKSGEIARALGPGLSFSEVLQSGAGGAPFDTLRSGAASFDAPRAYRVPPSASRTSAEQPDMLHGAAAPLCPSSSDALLSHASIRMCMGSDMGDELRIIEQACRDALALQERVLIVGPNGMWRSNAAWRLRDAGLPVEETPRHISVKDFRDERSCRLALDKTRERLRENPHDGVAWRCFIGFGDYVARSAGLESVRAVALAEGMGIEEALEKLSEGCLPGIDATDWLHAPLVEAYRRCRAFIESVTFGECVVQDEFGNSVVAPVRGGEGGQWSGSCECGRQSRGSDACTIRIVSPDEAVDQRADLVIFGGFVNGAIPSREFLDGVSLVGSARERACRTDIRALYSAVGAARCQVLLTGFGRCSLEVAERMGLHIAKIKLRRGLRVCEIEPSAYAPLLVSG